MAERPPAFPAVGFDVDFDLGAILATRQMSVSIELSKRSRNLRDVAQQAVVVEYVGEEE